MARTSATRRKATVVPAVDAAAEIKPHSVQPAVDTRASGPTEQQIRVRAFEIYQSRCRAGRPGDAASDWAQAERELKQAARSAAAAIRPM